MQIFPGNQADILDRIFGDEMSAAHIVSSAVARKDYALLEQAFSRIPLEWIKERSESGSFHSARPDGPLGSAVKAGDVEMVRYLHSKGIYAPVSLSHETSVGDRKLPGYVSDVIARAVDAGHEDVALELIFNHPEFADDFAKTNSMSAVLKRSSDFGYATVLTSALQRGMSRLARAALDHMDVTVQEDLIFASMVDSDLAPEIASKCIGISISNSSGTHFARHFGTQAFESLDTRGVPRAAFDVDAAQEIFADLVVGGKLKLLIDGDWSTGTALSDAITTMIKQSWHVPDRLVMYVLDSVPLHPWLIRDMAVASVRADRLGVVRELVARPSWGAGVIAAMGEAQSREMVDLLVSAGGCVDSFSEMGFTPLQECVRFGRAERIEFWADAGADLALKSRDGKTLIHLSPDEGTKRLVRSLRMGDRVTSAMSDGDDSAVSSPSVSPL